MEKVGILLKLELVKNFMGNMVKAAFMQAELKSEWKPLLGFSLIPPIDERVVMF